MMQRAKIDTRSVERCAVIVTSLATVCLTLLVAQANAATPAAQVPQNAVANAASDLFTNASVPKLRLEIPPEGIAILQRDRVDSSRTANLPRTHVLGTVRERAALYTNVSISFRGALGSFRPIDDYPELTLDFAKFAPSQRFHGLQKVSLYNSVQDPTCLTEQICRELFAAAGVPVPRATHAQVELNGRDLWLYVLVEGWNEQFLRRYFKNTTGNLYVGYFVREITDDLASECGQNPQDRSDLAALAAAAKEPGLTNRLARLGNLLDLDRFISMIAMETMQCHWDGYAQFKNNYRAYGDPDSRRLVFMPDGMDMMFGYGQATPDSPVLPRMHGLLATALIETAEGRRRFVERMSELRTNLFKVAAITNRVNELASKIRPVLAEHGPEVAQHHERLVADLCERIALRARSLEHQLAVALTTTEFDILGVARLSGWQPKPDFGQPRFDPLAGPARNGLLHISALQKGSVGSWRTKVFLPAGRYRFEGRIRTRGVVPDPGDPRGGVGLRTANRQFDQKLSGNNDWTTAACEFDVPQGADVELVCELRAAKGEGWFDSSSLRLIRK